MTEELQTLEGREGKRLKLSGTITDEDGVGIDGGTLTTQTVTIYDVQSGTMILDHAVPGTSGLSISSLGVWTLTIKSTWMTITDTNLRSGNYERHRVLMQFATAIAGQAFNHEFDIIVRKVGELV